MRRAQFLITTIVLVSLTIVLTVSSLYIPAEINANTLGRNELMINNLLFTKQTLEGLTDYFRINWMLPYTHRTVIKTRNNFTARDFTAKAEIDLPDNAYSNSLNLIDEDGLEVPFGIEWNNSPVKLGALYFQANGESLSNKKYYLYYNVAPGKTIINDKEQMMNYADDNNSFWVRTGNYYAFVNKSNGGSIKVFNNSGSRNLIINIDNIIKCGGTEYTLTNAVSQQVTVTGKDYYLKAVFTGSRFINETYKITELFFPDEILITDEMTMAGDSACNYWSSRITADKTVLMNYADSNRTTYEPAPEQSLTLIGTRSWFELYGSGYGIGITGEGSVYASSTPSASTAEFRFIDGASVINKGAYTKEVRITPLAGARFNITKQYAKPAVTAANEEFDTEFTNLFNIINKYFYDVNAVVTYNKITGLRHEEFKNSTDWYGSLMLRDYFTISGPDILTPVEAQVRLAKGADMNSIILYNKGAKPYQVSTTNYERGGSGTNELENTHVNNSLLLFNPNGKDFNITVTKLSGDLTGRLYFSNGSPLNEYNIDTSNYNIQVTQNNQSGFYNILFNGSGAFRINTSLPKTLITLPLEVSNASPVNTSPIYLLVNESVTAIDLSITTYTSNVQNFTLYDASNETVTSIVTSSQGTVTINKLIVPCVKDCIYRLEVNNSGAFMLNSSSIKYASASKDYMINPDMPEIIIVNVNMLGGEKKFYAYYNNNTFINRAVYGSDLVYSLSEKQVNNSFYSFDLDDITFYYKGVEWFGGRGWVTCTNSCVNNFNDVRFVELGSERVVALANTSVGVEYYFHFYPNTTYFKVIIKSTSNYSFGPSWKINNTDDKYYQYKGSAAKALGDNTKHVSKTNITGPQAFLTKSDDTCSASVLFNTNVLELNNSISVNDTAIILKAALPGTYAFVINENPEDYLTPTITKQDGITLTYNYTTSQLVMSGQLTG